MVWCVPIVFDSYSQLVEGGLVVVQAIGAMLIGMFAKFGFGQGAFGSQLVQGMWDVLPTGLQTSLAVIQPYYAAADHWIPVAYVFSLVLAFFTFWAAFVVFKMTLKLIPTIG